MKNVEYRHGSPSLREWEGWWRHSESDPPATLKECRVATNLLWDYLETKYRVGSGDWDDLFLRGDFLGDRSQTLELVYPPVLSPDFLDYVMAWLRQTDPKWRIIIPTFLGHREAFVIYPERVRFDDLIEKVSLETCQKIARKMLRLEAFRHARERALEEGFITPLDQ